ncbi:MAG: rhomboid family intramembrane serine protease [Lachnospiraceae bacterium]|nr:rhomboid family intramembrane serine protease [Lachnospiraceae bacterium]
MRSIMEKYGKLPLISGVLVLMNVVVFLLCLLTGDRLYVMGRVSVFETIMNKEFSRLLWAMFLHGDVNHLFNNMLILSFLGEIIEKEIGHIPYLLIYLLSGVGGNLSSLLFKMISDDWSVSIGASGAVFGLDGVLLALVLFAGREIPTVTPVRVVLMIVLSLYNGFAGMNIDNAAHVGGLITGFVLGAVLCVIQRRMREENKE